ncbi:SUN domain-containing protein 1-like isoform X3 [Micropterus salmoides]|uniref:SUN domain-containing protein 1-like isoform X3 n=1 Tax=Micropterus salmoides TaxID=27706 RepID=UPI0018EBC3ED|nr:SUN domain-containing protein 1-like isoform X3 [Micropterus salmoides]
MSVWDEDLDLQSCWGWTDLSSYSSAASDSEKEQQILSGIMSRRSLRLDDGLLDRSLPLSSASFSVGGGGWRNARSLKSHRSQQHSASCSESLLLSTPCKLAGQPPLLNSSLHSVASDASLLSSLLDESSVQETTLVDTFWGLDHDVDPKESTVIAEQTLLADRTLIGSDGRCPKHPVQTLSRVYCKDCELSSDRREAVASYCSSSKYTPASLTGPGPSEPGGQETSTIYSRDRSRKSRTDVLRLWLDSSLPCVRRAAACCVSVLTHTWQVCRALASQVHARTAHRRGGRSGRCGVMNLRESSTNQKELQPSGSLCDDCEGKRRSDTDDAVSSPSASWSSVASCLLGLMWSAAVFTASCLWRLTLRAAAAIWPLTKEICSASRSAARSAGKTAVVAYRWLNGRWHPMTAGFLRTRSPLTLLLVLLPLLLLFSLCSFGPAGLQSVNITEWRTAVSDVSGLSSIYSFMSPQSQSAEGAVEESREVQPYVELTYSRPPPAETPSGEEAPLAPGSAVKDEEEEEEEEAEAAAESVRLVRLEQSLTALWERVEAGGRRAEQRHREVARLYADLQGDGEGLEPWLSGLLDRQLDQLRRQLDEERLHRDQTRQQDLLQQQSQTSRLDQLELQLRTLAAKTEEVQRRHEAAAVPTSPTTLPAAVSVGVDRLSHDALLAEVARLAAALEDVRQHVEDLSECQGDGQQLDRIRQTVREKTQTSLIITVTVKTRRGFASSAGPSQLQISAHVSAQVREEVRTLVYGNQLAVRGGASGDDDAGLPESLLRWLSQQYVTGADLKASLASLELSILQNISLQLEQRRSEETVREAVLHATGAAGAAVTTEDVRVIVENALRLFSQDRTGLADYALESGGGSVLSTRCSQTYKTKAALLSLFGVPLWYFSQSPRVVIQPDVHPGNCWAFRGSAGFLVIRLSMKIVPTAFSLEHIPKALAPSGTLLSAPRDFSVYGLDDESQERGTLLGSYSYDQDGEALQTFSVAEQNDRAFQIIELQVSSNWGHQEYTCMYRFRVHGTPEDAPETSI